MAIYCYTDVHTHLCRFTHKQSSLNTHTHTHTHSLLRSSSRSAEGWYDLHRNGSPVKSQTGVSALHLRFAFSPQTQTQSSNADTENANSVHRSGVSIPSKNSLVNVAPLGYIPSTRGVHEKQNKLSTSNSSSGKTARASRLPPPPVDKLTPIEENDSMSTDSGKTLGLEKHSGSVYGDLRLRAYSDDSLASAETVRLKGPGVKDERLHEGEGKKKSATAENHELKK